MEKNKLINYKRIYQDLLTMKFPDKIRDCQSLLDKKELTGLDIIQLNEKIFDDPNKQTTMYNQQLRSYIKSDILKILEYQDKYQLNNTQLAIHFKLSRNTVAKWKKIFMLKSNQ